MPKHYSSQELEKLHEVLYEILAEVVRVCTKHDIPYFVIGGTAIGALYDKAILPWDDDIDIGMKRDDYERFLQIAPRELGQDYFLSWLGTDPRTPYHFTKVKKTTSRSPCTRVSLWTYSPLIAYPIINCSGVYNSKRSIS